jgi:cell fate regulator YaaT (PSP1 superfamily)
VAHLIEIAFKGNRKEFYLWPDDTPPAPRSAVVVEADRGEDVGRVHAVGDLARLRARGCTHGTGDADPTLKALRVASSDDVRKLAELRDQDESARRDAMRFVRTHALPMKLTDTEWRWDRRKLTIYFTADRRVDFRALVRDLATHFHTRIELKQIGVRDEAKRLDGIGRCGRSYCSASWLRELRPVNLGLAKDQKLSLNPTQISGACGRLMCSIRYEHDWYVETRRRFPKEGKSITTALGEERVVANDLFRERVTLRRVADGEMRVIALAQLNKELRGEPVESDADTEALAFDELNDDVVAMTDTMERRIPRAALRTPSAVDRPVSLARAPQRPPPAPREPAPPSEAPAAQADTEVDAEANAHPRSRRRRGRRGGHRGGGGRRGSGDLPGGAPPAPGGGA